MKATQDQAGTTPSAQTPLAGGASIDKVRDILFGVQMRDYDKRFARLEERLLKETSDLKDDVKKRLASLEQFMKQEFESLGDRLSSEHVQPRGRRQGPRRQLQRESATAFEKKTAAIDDQLAKAQRELRQQLLDLQKGLTEDILQRHQDMVTMLSARCRRAARREGRPGGPGQPLHRDGHATEQSVPSAHR